MKRAVKLQRREMKKEIKRLTQENEKLNIRCNALAFRSSIDRCNVSEVSCARTIPSFYRSFNDNLETIKDQTKKQLARELGEFLLDSGLFEVQETDDITGLEIRLIYRHVQFRKETC